MSPTTTEVPEPRAAAFLARVLASPTLSAEYPLVFDPRGSGEMLELVEEGAVRAACTLLVREFVLGARRIRAGLIGSVATDPAWRRRGLATRLLAQAEARLAERGCLFTLLWADEPGFYLARGYAPFGSECDVLLVPELASLLPAPDGVRELRASDVPFLHRLYARHPARVERTPAESAALLAIPGMLTLVRERAAAPGQPVVPVAYACLGRGRDLADALHEWGGEPTDVLALVRAHLERRADSTLFLMAPPGESELAYRLLRLGAPVREGILGLGKLLGAPGAGALLKSLLPTAETSAWNGTHLTLRGPRAGSELDLELLQSLLFGGPEVRAEVQAFLGRLGFERAPLPLEPFAFGLDSI